MVEGLQSKDSAVRSLTQAWVHSATSQGHLHRLIEPLVRIILDQNDKRKVFTVQPSDGRLVEDSGKYYYSPTASHEPQLTQAEEMRLVYTQVLDTDQVLYALNLVQAVVAVAPGTVIRSLASSVVSVGMYGHYDSANHLNSSDQSATGQKSLLEVILLSLIAFLRSEYPDTLDVTLSDVNENLRVKSTAVELISFLTLQFSLILSSADMSDGSTGSSGSGSLIHNPSYVSALVTLCDVQKVLLLTLAQVVRCLGQPASTAPTLMNGNGEAPTVSATNKTGAAAVVDGRDPQLPSVQLRVLFMHLLRCLQNLVSLDTQCIPSSPAALTPSTKHAKKSLSNISNLIQPGLCTVAQPFFQSLVTDILANPSLADLHSPLLHMFSATLPNLHGYLDDLAPKILRQLCQNLETGVLAEKTRSEQSSQDGVCVSESAGGGGGMAIVSNLQALVNIILWCLFGENAVRQVSLKHNLLNRFWDASHLNQTDSSDEVVSPASKQPSAMSWLFGVFATAAQNKSVSSPVGTKSLKLGLSQSKVGHSVILLLPALYNALTEVWTWVSGRATPHSASGISSRNDRGTAVAVGKRGRGGSWLEGEKKRAEYEASH